MAEQKTEAMTLKEVVAVRYITAENAKFEKQSDFVKMTVRFPNEEGVEEETVYDRIFLHRAFPFDFPYAYISVLDMDSKEIGIIREIDELGEETAKLLRDEIADLMAFAVRISAWSPSAWPYSSLIFLKKSISPIRSEKNVPLFFASSYAASSLFSMLRLLISPVRGSTLATISSS